MKLFIFTLFTMLLFSSTVANAQEDVTYRPSATTTAWRAAASELGIPASTICLVTCDDALTLVLYTDPLNHVGCSTAEASPVATVGEVSNPLGSGDMCYRAVSVSASGAISEPSVNSATVQDLPLPPTLVKE